MQSSNKIIDTIKTRDGHKSGSLVDTKFIFYCTDGSDKSFNMTGSSDFYYEKHFKGDRNISLFFI